jgi:hypothetical protein
VLDGRDVSTQLLGKGTPASSSEPRTLYSLYGLNKRRLESFREGNWKLHLSDPPALYDLSVDLGETANVAAQHPEIVQRLAGKAKQARMETNIPEAKP